MRELVYYVAVSLDGYIAGPGGECDAFLAQGDHAPVVFEEYADALPGQAHAALGITPPRTRFDTVVMGWNTLRPALDDIEARLDGLTALRARPAGTIRITANRTAARGILYPKVARLMAEYPDIRVEISVEQSFVDIVEDASTPACGSARAWSAT